MQSPPRIELTTFCVVVDGLFAWAIRMANHNWHEYRYSKIPLSRTWFISNTPLISKLIAGPCRFHYINDLKNSWYLEHGYLEYPAYLEVYLWSQAPILPRLSRSAVKFLVCLTYLASLRYQFTPVAIYTHYNLCYPRRSLILRCLWSVNELNSLGN
jgi:hypothetical protein